MIADGWAPYAELWDEAAKTLVAAYVRAPGAGRRTSRAVLTALVVIAASIVVVGVAGRLVVPGLVGLGERASPSPTLGIDTGAVPRFEAGTCRSSWVYANEAKCGDLVVLEDRSRPDGPRIRLHVAILSSWHPSPRPDPIVYLEGGPGGSALTDGFTMYPLANERELVVFDQRGTGYSRPSLQCGEAILMLLLPEEADFIRRCRERLAERGVDLAAYDTTASAADVEDLRISLGYEQWNLYGISYGTRLALEVMRQHPDGVRSAILDSVYPMGADLYAEGAVNAQRAFNELFAGCAANAECATAYPELENHFYEVVTRLDVSPRSAGGLFGLGALEIDGGMFIRLLFLRMYVTDYIESLPASIEAFWAGNWAELDSWVVDLAGADGGHPSLLPISIGLHYSVQCAEALPFADRSRLGIIDHGVDSAVFHAFDWQYMVDHCAIWNVPAVEPAFNDAVVSAIPTLLLAGTYDPITPPLWAEQASQTLAGGQLMVVPGMGHGVVGGFFSNGCVDGIVERFLARPEAAVSARCLEDIEGPPFIVP